MDIFNLNTVWFVLVGVLFTGYAMLDGFDLGTGILHLFTKTDLQRRTMLNAIGPVWDGNEVWLVTGGGALFAAFPHVYATLLSSFYDLFMILLLGIIFRAVAIEFRSKRPGALWRQIWDVMFFLGSFVPAFLMGVIIGNVVWGIPLQRGDEFHGSVLDFFHPFALLAGVTTVCLFAMHGAIYIYLKTEGEMQIQAKRWMYRSTLVFLVVYLIFDVLAVFGVPHVRAVIGARPHIMGVMLINLIAIACIFWSVKRSKESLAFVFSCLTMLTLMMLFGLTMYPNLIYSVPELHRSLNIYNAASSHKTLSIMFLMACIGVPIVLAYTISVYWIFRGKVQITDESY